MASTNDYKSSKTNSTITPYYLLSTVTDNEGFYTRADIEGSDRARIYQGLIG